MPISNLNVEISKTNLWNSLNDEWQTRAEAIKADKSIESLNLLYLLNLLNRNWSLLYRDVHNCASLAFLTKTQSTDYLIAPSEFINPKLAAKANRQLQDPLVVMTGHLPRWLPDLMSSLQFVFPFETRLMYFYVSGLDRDRAMQKLIDMNAFDLLAVGHADATTTGSSSGTHATDRLKPRLEKRKKTINRALDLFKQADAVLTEFTAGAAASYSRPTRSLALLGGTLAAASAASSSSSSSKPPLLEIQYENEVGTGLGPTLEFYALMSLEMQKCVHEMWRGERVKIAAVSASPSADANKDELYFHSGTGLFPAPVSLYIKGMNSSI